MAAHGGNSRDIIQLPHCLMSDRGAGREQSLAWLVAAVAGLVRFYGSHYANVITDGLCPDEASWGLVYYTE